MQPIKYTSAVIDRCEAILKEGDGMIIVQTAREGQHLYTKLYKGVYKNTLMYFPTMDRGDLQIEGLESSGRQAT